MRRPQFALWSMNGLRGNRVIQSCARPDFREWAGVRRIWKVNHERRIPIKDTRGGAQSVTDRDGSNDSPHFWRHRHCGRNRSRKKHSRSQCPTKELALCGYLGIQAGTLDVGRGRGSTVIPVDGTWKRPPASCLRREQHSSRQPLLMYSPPDAPDSS
ncbi:MAG: hypothetical protein QOF94_1406, partial [Acidobacteriaceae bacterium]